MLYLPWRNEDHADLLGGYPDFCSLYETMCEDILANEQKPSHNATLINKAMDDLTEHEPLQHAWNQVPQEVLRALLGRGRNLVQSFL